MTMRAEEVSEEDSPVEILDPQDPVFQGPNRITARDFEGWWNSGVEVLGYLGSGL